MITIETHILVFVEAFPRLHDSTIGLRTYDSFEVPRERLTDALQSRRFMLQQNCSCGHCTVVMAQEP